MKTLLMASALLLSSTFVFAKCALPLEGNAQYEIPEAQQDRTVPSNDNTRIQVAILLDTSNSMDGLIDQAKSRLWNIINTLTTLKYKGKTPVIEIALYEYGNDGLSVGSDYIRKVTPLTTDLDLISEKLFALQTNGGNEYCGAVIAQAVRQLEWRNSGGSDMKLIYIAGNEPFDQGSISYKESIRDARAKDIFINTIFCGSKGEGTQTFWKDGADRGLGKYFNIDSDRKVRFIETPYDARIEACNERMNKTYISYGAKGASKRQSQVEQDMNAKSISKANYAERAVSKSQSAYKNESWDLVDKVKEDRYALDKMKKDDLPEELKDKNSTEIKAIVTEKTKERAAIQKEIETLAKQRQAYIDEENKKAKTEDDLGAAINNSILDIAKMKGYVTAR
jgi:hypothetical protein